MIEMERERGERQTNRDPRRRGVARIFTVGCDGEIPPTKVKTKKHQEYRSVFKERK